ncbi:hypothetical protein GCM10017691_36700 [Pseudonocardia petroleophila]|uniref:Uncharacterized protein n=1 Tax=Pseudonocardia petroleophila TaxID=37331 RepID=A0A7G7MCR3_9PSEU|nr:hypothetical protein [Pseudonocardia petroleophila]QNG50574.1 hypothetical protein H6H00_20370 [Pseudonocardia petroleophila]
MSENQPGQEPQYGEETDQEPHYPADGGTADDAGPGSGAGPANPDLHGAAREVEEGASGDGAAKTSGA